jgi:hypothetical protein
MMGSCFMSFLVGICRGGNLYILMSGEDPATAGTRWHSWLGPLVCWTKSWCPSDVCWFITVKTLIITIVSNGKSWQIWLNHVKSHFWWVKCPSIWWLKWPSIWATSAQVLSLLAYGHRALASTASPARGRGHPLWADGRRPGEAWGREAVRLIYYRYIHLPYIYHKHPKNPYTSLTYSYEST